MLRRDRLAAVIAAAALVCAVVAVDRRPRREEAPVLRSIEQAWAELEWRPTEARLSGFAYRPARPARPGRALPLPLDLPHRVAEFLERSGGNDRRSAGLAMLLAARFDEAVTSFGSCPPSSDPRCWSDLAAVYLELGQMENRPLAIALGFAAADRAVEIDSRVESGLFNRAIALEALHLDEPAAIAWRRYLAVDPGSPWSDEARARLAALHRGATSTKRWTSARNELARAAARDDADTVRSIVARFPQEARTSSELLVLEDWAEAIFAGDDVLAASRLREARHVGRALAAGHGESLLADAVAAIDRASGTAVQSIAEAQRAYYRGRDLYRARDVAASLPWFLESASLFRRAGSPMARLAEYYAASCLSDLGRTDDALRSIGGQLAACPADYIALRAQLIWQRAAVLSRLGLVFETLLSFRESLELFTQAGEAMNATSVREMAAAHEAMLGRDADAWRTRLEAFEGASRTGDLRVLQGALLRTGRGEAAAGRWDIAFSVFGLALDPQLARPNPAQAADLAIWRPLASHRIGMAGARDELVRARAMVAELADPVMRATSESRLLVVQALIARDDDPESALGLLTQAVDQAQAVRETFYLPEMLVERARTLRMLGRDENAIADLEAALSLNRERDRSMGEIELRDTNFVSDAAAAEELVDLHDRRGDTMEAFRVADANRALSFRFGTSSMTWAPNRRIARGTLIVHFTVLPDRLLVVGIGAHGFERHRVAIGREELKRSVARLVKSIVDGNDAAAKKEARELEEHLLGPLESQLAAVQTLVFVPDETLAGVPFAALVRPDGSFLIETHAIVHAPSAAQFVASAGRRPSSSGMRSVLAVGNPAFDSSLAPRLERLPSAEAEAIQVGRSYERADVVTGEEATRRRVMTALPRHSIVDLACHAVVDAHDPSRSLLLLAPEGDDRGLLYLRDVARLSLPATEVVNVAACKSAAIAERAPAATRSFVLAFLAAGSRNVLGALWDMEDEIAARLSTSFHDNLAAGLPPAEALRAAQLRLLRSGSERASSLRAWSGFQLYGAGD